MLLICPICRAECTVDDQSVDTVTCPTCGQQLSTRTGTPVPQDVIGDTPAAKDETREWHEEVVSPTADIDVLPVRLGRYFIESLIAQGGFAKVYLATDEELGRRVALKIPRLEKFKTPAKLREFLAEARIAAKLRHPGIVTIFDVGQFANRTNYIAMEYVAGQSLSDLMNAGRIPVPRAVDLLIKVAEAVHDAHRQGLVHRDLKPGNILIDERGEPRVVDFGLAVHETAQGQLQGEIAGTPAYMSPEQFRGEVHRLDGRTDIWSLGVVLYQLLTGRRPFSGDVNQLYDEVLNKAPKPPRQIDDQIPRELEAICFKCLSKSVDDRYTTAKDLADDLRAWLETKLIDERPVSISVVSPLVATESSQRRIVTRWVLLGLAIFIASGMAMMAVSLPGKALTDHRPNGPNPKRQQVGKAVLASFRVDDRVQPSVWFPLLDREPKPLIWCGDPATEYWRYDAGLQNVSVDCVMPLLAEFGETSAKEYELQLTVSKNNLSGEAGLFWGYTPEEPDNPRTKAVFQTVSLYCDLINKPDVIQIRRETCNLNWQSVSTCASIDRSRISAAAAAPPIRDESVLAVRIQRGFVTSVRWQGNELPNLRDGIKKDTFAVRLPRGGFGIFNSNGAARFGDARFRLVDVPPPQP